MDEVKLAIEALAEKYSNALKLQIDQRVGDMKLDDKSHYLVYRVLGITDEEGDLIDVYQNKGRFLYKYAGSFLEEATIICFEHKFPEAQRKVKIPNKAGSRPATFEIDVLVDKTAYEIKWKDATTDGDHITKEHTRVKSISEVGYIPVRIMFYYPNRAQAIKIQDTIQTLYKGLKGEHYFAESAWQYVKKTTGIDLKKILEEIANKRVNQK